VQISPAQAAALGPAIKNRRGTLATNSMTTVGAKDMPDQATNYIADFSFTAFPAFNRCDLAKHLGIAG
jgi:hypothetical protein